MSHLDDERIYALAVAADAGTSAATSAEAEHLRTCPHCRAAVAEMRLLLDDLRLYAAATPSPEARARYHALAADIDTGPSLVARVQQAMAALLAWDSRTQAGAVRQGAAVDYRLLYTTAHADIELMVSATGATRRIEGEFIPRDPGAVSTAMIELYAGRTSVPKIATTRADGRFRLDAITPGAYRVMVVPTIGQLQVIEQLEIS